MDKRLCLALLVSLSAAGAARAAGFDELYAAPLPAPGAVLPEDRHAVTYSLRGLVTVYPDKTVLNTEDGRVFILELSEEEAAAYDNRTVELWGKAEAPDDLHTIKVSSIREYAPDPAAVLPPPRKGKFRPAKLLGEADGILSVANMRWLAPDAQSHDFSWSTAAIRTELLKEIYFVTKVQPPGIAGHSLLFYEFEDGGLTDTEGRIQRLSCRWRLMPEGQSYSLLAGTKPTT